MGRNTIGLIVGTRGFFPANLANEGRKEFIALLKKKKIDTVVLDPSQTTNGAVETLDDAKKCAALFKSRAADIDGVVVTLPNFGDEKAVANTLRMSDLNVPVLVQAYPDDLDKMAMGQRRDSFCGKLSVCNNLKQYGIPFSLTTLHTISPSDPLFLEDLDRFLATCSVVKGLRRARFGAIGARTGPFNTVRYSERILERSGITIETIDLSEILGAIEKMSDSEPDVKKRLRAIKRYVSTEGVPTEPLVKMAKLALAIDRWMTENDLAGSTLQCWTAIEDLLGVVPCTVMSMMSNRLLPSACEVDVGGLIGMYALQLASGQPSALLDWNNNYGGDPDRLVFFHCSNLPKSFFSSVCMSSHDILKETIGDANSYGVCVGRIAPGPFTFARVCTFDEEGTISTYVGEGEFTDEPLDSFGGIGVAHIPDLQFLLEYICRAGFEHHVAISQAEVSSALADAFETYLGWDVYHHTA